MKIALIIERMDIQLGGAERSISELSQALSDQGLDVTLLAARGRSDSIHGHVLCEGSGNRTSHTTFAKALKTHLCSHSYDIVHSVLPFDFADIYQPRGGTYAETIEQNAASFQNPLVANIKRRLAFTNRRRQQWLAAERSLSSGPKGPVIAALSQYVVRQFKQHYRTPDDRVVLITNGVRIPPAFDLDSVDAFRMTLFDRLNLPSESSAVLFLFAAHNFRLKGLKPLLHAFAHARRSNRVLLIAGHGNQAPYHRLIEKLGLQHQVLFLGNVSTVELALAVSHVAVLPTFYDPASRFIIEALAAYKPVITTRFNGACDLFEPNRHGLVIDTPTDIPALALALNTLTDNETRHTMTDAIRQDHLRQKVGIDRVAQELIDLYTAILIKKGPL